MQMAHPDLVTINTADDATAARLLVRFVENAPALAAHIAAHRPFVCATALADAIDTAITALEPPLLMAFFRGHPVLSPVDPDKMTAESQREQARLSLTSANADLRDQLTALNAQYMERFGFPCIIALYRIPDTATLLQVFRTRLDASPTVEIIANRTEILLVSRARVIAAMAS
jgi:2-oxo-4-hydroxy-4-carboxy-5-ureidoimidazoline decarboxylase